MWVPNQVARWHLLPWMDEETTVVRWYKTKWKERWFVQTWWSGGLVCLHVSATSLSKLAPFFIHFPPQYFPKPHPSTSAKLNKIWVENPSSFSSSHHWSKAVADTHWRIEFFGEMDGALSAHFHSHNEERKVSASPCGHTKVFSFS